MITVNDILALPAFKSIEILSPIEGAGERRVYNVGILDCPPTINGYRAYMPGEFILTNLGFAYGNPRLSDESLIAMIRRGVAAIAIKDVYEPSFSEAIRRESTRCNVPVYLYSGAYHERVAYQALDLLQRDEKAQDKSDAIDDLVAGMTREKIRQAISEIAGLTGSSVQCAAISAKQDDRCSLYAIQDKLNDAFRPIERHSNEAVSACAFRYHDALLAFASYRSVEPDEESTSTFEKAIASIGPIYYGIGDLVPLGETDLSIRQATILLAEAHVRDKRRMEWQDLGLDAFSYAAKANPLFTRTSLSHIRLLEAYDTKNDTELMTTARAYVGAFGDVSSTARALHQHPNTIRYRLRRIRSLLSLDNASDRELMVFLSFIFLG